jgi:hypothetical protein
MHNVSHYIRQILLWRRLLWLPAFGFSQNKIIDSLNNLVNSSPGDSLWLLAFIEPDSNYYGCDTLKGDLSIRRALFILHQEPWSYNLRNYYLRKSQILWNRYKYELSLTLDDFAIALYKRAGWFAFRSKIFI